MEGFSLSGFLIFILKLLLVKILFGITLAIWRGIKKTIFKKKDKEDDSNHDKESKS